MRGNYIFFMLARRLSKQHKKSRRRKYHPETRTLQAPERNLLIGHARNQSTELWSPRYTVVAPVIHMAKPEVQVIRGEPETETTQTGSGFYFTADGVLYGPYDDIMQVTAALDTVVKSGAKTISDVERRN